MHAPSDGAPEQAPRWDLVDTESYGGGIRFLAPVLIVWGYVCIYRRKEYVGGATWAPRGWRARLPGCFLDVGSKSSGSRLFRKSRPEGFILFGIPFLQNSRIGKKTETGTRPPVNRLVPKIM